MLGKFISIAAMVLLLACVPIRAEQTTRLFTSADAQSAIDSMPLQQSHCELEPAYAGSDTSAFHFSWNDVGGNFKLLKFSASPEGGVQKSLKGWICPGLNRFQSKAARLVLVYDDNLETITEINTPVVGFFEAFRLPLPAHPRTNRFALLIHVSDSDLGWGAVVLTDVRLVDDAAATQPQPAMAQQTISLPPSDFSMQQLQRFTGNDFDPHCNSSLDSSSLNPVSQLGSDDGREINILVPSFLPGRAIPILALDDPPTTAADYAIAGDISYGSVAPVLNGQTIKERIDGRSDGDVEGSGYLEMISDFSDGSSTTTIANADSGPLRMIRGRSGPRQFLLPAHSTKRLTRLRMDLVMPGRATIALSNLRLVQYVPPVAVASNASSNNSSRLFSPRTIWIPVAVLPFFSLVALLEPLVVRGKGRLLVMVWIWTFFALSQMAFAWSMAAWGHGLATRDIAPSLGASLLILFCTLFASRRMSRRYRDAELRKMQLMDAI